VGLAIRIEKKGGRRPAQKEGGCILFRRSYGSREGKSFPATQQFFEKHLGILGGYSSKNRGKGSRTGSSSGRWKKTFVKSHFDRMITKARAYFRAT